MIIKIEGICQFEGCTKLATMIACGRYNPHGHPVPGCYCNEHAQLVADEGSPEYIEQCPNCACCFGV